MKYIQGGHHGVRMTLTSRGARADAVGAEVDPIELPEPGDQAPGVITQ